MRQPSALSACTRVKFGPPAGRERTAVQLSPPAPSLTVSMMWRENMASSTAMP